MTIACITGAGSGIGRALALELVSRGFTVVAVGRRRGPLEALKALQPSAIEVIAADIVTTKGRQCVVDAMQGQAGSLLIHNAGLSGPLSLLSDVSLDDYRQVMQVNCEAPLFLTQSLLPNLIGGRVLHISTGLAHFALKGSACYTISKMALYGLYLNLKADFQNKDIAFGSVMPGMIDTPMVQDIINTPPDHQDLGPILKQVQDSGHLLKPATVAKFLAWLLLDTDAKQFSRQEWDIYEKSHHAHWADCEVVNPLER